MYKSLTWASIAAAAILLLMGLAGAFVPQGKVLISPRGCTLLAQLFLLFAVNFSLLRLIGLKEEGK